MKKNVTLLLTFLLSGSVSFGQTLVKTYYDFDHKEVHEVYYTNNYGVKNGSYVEYSEYGGILTQGTYKNDKSVGHWIIKNEKGILLVDENYDNDGYWNGQVARYTDGYKYAQEEYKHGVKSGHWKEWFQDETASKVYLKPDGTTQLEHDYYYKNDLQDSTEKYYNQSGVLLSKINYMQGLKNGKAIFYTHEGSGTVWKSGDFRNDTSVAEWKEVFDNQNQPAKMNKSDAAYYRITDYGDGSNTNNVKATDYYLSGEKQSEETLGPDGFVGWYTEYYMNGTISKKGKYKSFRELNNNYVREYVTVTGEDSIWDLYSIKGADSVKLKYENGKLDSTWSVFH